MTGNPNTCEAPHHTEHRYDRDASRWSGYDPRVQEWGPCSTSTPQLLSLDGPAGDLDARGARLRAEPDALDLQKTAARTEALDTIGRRMAVIVEHGKALDEAVAEAHAYGATWQQIADAAGLTK